MLEHKCAVDCTSHGGPRDCRKGGGKHTNMFAHVYLSVYVFSLNYFASFLEWIKLADLKDQLATTWSKIGSPTYSRDKLSFKVNACPAGGCQAGAGVATVDITLPFHFTQIQGTAQVTAVNILCFYYFFWLLGLEQRDAC